jgi:hypothetical protein
MARLCLMTGLGMALSRSRECVFRSEARIEHSPQRGPLCISDCANAEYANDAQMTLRVMSTQTLPFRKLVLFVNLNDVSVPPQKNERT